MCVGLCKNSFQYTLCQISDLLCIADKLDILKLLLTTNLDNIKVKQKQLLGSALGNCCCLGDNRFAIIFTTLKESEHEKINKGSDLSV